MQDYRVKAIEKLARDRTKPWSYTIAKGDTFDAISKKTKIPSGTLMADNRQIDPRRMQIGQHVYIRGVQPKPVRPAVVPAVGSAPAGSNNPGNLRFYHQNWLGELPTGLKDGDFTSFDTPQHGLRAAARTIMNYGKTMVPLTINKIVPKYSPKTENDLKQHASNISKGSGLGLNDKIDTKNDAQMLKLMRGLIESESGKDTADGFTDDDYLKAIRDGRISM